MTMRAPLLGLLLFAATAAQAAPADFSGVWMRSPQRGASVDPRGVNPAVPPPPMKAPHDAEYAASQKIKKAAEEAGEPISTDKAECLPDGMPFVLGTSLPFEIANTANGLLQVFEFNTQVRHIYTDTDKHPGPDDIEYNFYGDSIAHWEGQALVVDTVGVRTGTLLFNDAPHGENLHIGERYELIDKDLLRITLTLQDPDYLAARQKSMKIREYVCLENQRSFVDSAGRVGLIIKDK